MSERHDELIKNSENNPNEPLRSQVEAIFREHERAIQLANTERERAVADLKEFLGEKVEAGDTLTLQEVNSVKEILSSRLGDKFDQVVDRIQAGKEAEQTATEEREKAARALREETREALGRADRERENSAKVLREETQRALSNADNEREKSAAALQKSVTEQIRSGDRELLLHIEGQKEAIGLLTKSIESLELRIEKISDKSVDEKLYKEFKDTQEKFNVDMVRTVDKNRAGIAEINSKGMGQDESRSSLVAMAGVAFGVISAIGLVLTLVLGYL